MVFAVFSSSAIGSVFLIVVAICSCARLFLSFELAIARGLDRRSQQAREVLQFRDHTVKLIEQRLQLMSYTRGAELLHERAVIPQRFYLWCGETFEYGVAILTHIAQDGARIVELVGSRNKTGLGIFVAYPMQITQLARIPLRFAFTC